LSFSIVSKFELTAIPVAVFVFLLFCVEGCFEMDASLTLPSRQLSDNCVRVICIVVCIVGFIGSGVGMFRPQRWKLCYTPSPFLIVRLENGGAGGIVY